MSRKSKLDNLLKYLRRLVLQATDNRSEIWTEMTPQERNALDKEYVRTKSLIARISRLKVNPVKPKTIFQ